MRISSRATRAHAAHALLGLIGALSCARGENAPAETVDSSAVVAPQAAAPMEVPPPPPESRYALLVAIDTYPQAMYNLPSPGQDVAALERLLRDRYEFPAANIRVLRNSAATRDAIIRGFRRHLTRAGQEGVALFYYVGRGLLMDRDYSIIDGKRDHGLFVWGPGNTTTVVLDDELDVMTRDLPAGRRVVLLDACYSGTPAGAWRIWHAVKDWLAVFGGEGVKSRGVVMSVGANFGDHPAVLPSRFESDSQRVTPLDSMPVVYMAAAGDREQAYSVPHWPDTTRSRAVFSYFLEKALDASKPGDDFLRVRDAVRANVQTRCALNHDECQTPQLHGGLRFQPIESVLGASATP